MRAKLDGDCVRDEYGDVWEDCGDDAQGHYMVHRDAGDKWEAGTFNTFFGEIDTAEDGKTFGINCRDEFIVRDGRWCDNDE